MRRAHDCQLMRTVTEYDIPQHIRQTLSQSIDTQATEKKSKQRYTNI